MCQKGRETSEHYFLKCPLYRNKRTIIDDLHNKANTDTVHIETILYGTKIKHRDRNKTIAQIVENYIRTTKRFDLS